MLLLFGFLQHQKTPKTNSCTNLHLVFFFCCCCCFTAEEVQLDQKKLFFKGGEISNSLHPFLFCFCLPDDTKDEEGKAHVMLDKEESKARVMLDTRKKRRFLNPQKQQQQQRTTHHTPLTTTKCFRAARIFGR